MRYVDNMYKRGMRWDLSENIWYRVLGDGYRIILRGLADSRTTSILFLIVSLRLGIFIFRIFIILRGLADSRTTLILFLILGLRLGIFIILRGFADSRTTSILF